MGQKKCGKGHTRQNILFSKEDMTFQWYRYPVRGNEHFIKILPDTVIIKYLAYCKRCKKEILVNVESSAETVNP